MRLPEDRTEDLEKKVVCSLPAKEWDTAMGGITLYKPCGQRYEIGKQVLCELTRAYSCEYKNQKYEVKFKRREKNEKEVPGK